MAHRLLDEENACGQTLLHLSARGNSIISEILRLSKKVPTVFYLASEADRAKFARIVYDYAYQERGDAIEDEILADPELLAADDAFRENNLERLERFWLLFDSIYVFYADVQRYLSDLATGVYIQQTVESVLANKDGKQLLAEIVSLYGTMLLLLDMRIPGVVRERMIISYYRYKRASDIEHIDEVSKLCAATGYVHGGPGGKGGRVPEDYPELLFARHTFDPSIVAMIIGRLRADDIYNQLANYPHPAHRSVALATQAAQLYVILFFDPVTLRDEEAVMREIVDKFFPDNWVIAYYLGFCADLSIAWSRYPAAAAAIRNTTATRNVERHKQIYLEKVETCLVDLNHLLTEGVLDEEFLMKKNPQILNVLRDCNVTIRWIMLHTTTKNKKLRELVVRDVSPDRLLLLLLNTAELEFKVKNMVEHLFKEKENRWEMCRREACQRMDELGEYFSGAKELTRVERNEELEAWFKKNSKRIADIDLNDALHAGRKLNHLIKALEEVEAYHQIEASIQVKEFLGDTRRFLRDMMLLVNVEDAIMVKILAIADLSYAWDIMRDYVALMQWRIQRDPGTVIRLRAVFVKLASILQVPLIRILFINSPDLITVSEYYSGELVHFVRTVIEVVPRTMFAHLDAIIDIATSRLVPLEPKILKEDLKNVAQLETRHELARLTHKISVFTLGVLAMETTLVGVVPVNPKELLEDGIRKELVRRIVLALDETMRFRPGKDELFRRLGVLATVLDGYKRSFEYIQDHVQIYGLKIWQEEFSRIVSFCVQMETNLFLRERVEPEDSVYQSSAVPIRLPPPTDRRSANWIGRLTRELLDITSPRTTIYVDLMNTWYDKGGNVVAGIRTMTELAEAVDVFGMRGVDKLLSFMNVASLRSFVAVYRSAMNPDMRAYLASVEETLSPLSTFPAVPNFAKMYGGFVKTLAKWWPLFQETVCPVGHRQVLRRQIARELSFQSKLSSNLLVCSLDTLNAAMMNDIREHYRDASNRPYPAADNPLIPELVEYLEIAGRGAPNNKIYMTTEPLEHLATLAFLFVVAQLEQFSYAPNLGTLVNTNKKVPLDGGPFVMGVVTLLKQFHSQHREKFLAMMGQYVRSLLHEEAKDMTSRRRGPGGEYPQAVTHALIFLEHFCEFSDTPRKSIENYVPAYIFDRFER